MATLRPDPTFYPSARHASEAPPERLAYLAMPSPSSARPDAIGVVDVDPDSRSYGRLVGQLDMPNTGDELHHFGWNACSSCHGDESRMRRYLVVPGLASSRIHILDAADPRAPKLHKVIEPEEIAKKTNLSEPHTVHCLSDGKIMISMLGNGEGNSPGGFLLLDDQFNIAGRWEQKPGAIQFNYDFWYQPRHNVMISSEWGAPKLFRTRLRRLAALPT